MRAYQDGIVVLRAWKLGGVGQVISLFIQDRDEVEAMAKGIRRTGSKFNTQLRLFGRVDM